jgi:hypothetical protein
VSIISFINEFVTVFGVWKAYVTVGGNLQPGGGMHPSNPS